MEQINFDIEALYKNVKDLEEISGSNAKKEFLQKMKDKQEFKVLMKFMYDTMIVTGLSTKKMSKDVSDIDTSEYSLTTIFNIMNYLENNNTGRDLDVAIIKKYMQTKDEKYHDMINKIATKTLKLGLTASTLNKVYGKDFIKKHEIMLAKSYKDHSAKVKGVFGITTKLDGMRITAKKIGDSVQFLTRQGKPMEGLSEIKADILKAPDGVYDGELLAKNIDNLKSDDLYRETMKVKSKDTDKKGYDFNVFDYMSVQEFNNGKSKDNWVQRRATMDKIFEKDFDNLILVPLLYVGEDLSKIQELLDKAIADDKEGVMINLDKPYECKRTANILKVKVFNTCDVLVKRVEEGTGKNEGKLGNIIIEFEHEGSKYECGVGSGFKDAEREMYWANPELILNKIVTIGYFEISNNQDGGFGLRFPTWKSIIRDDKTEISMN